MVFARDLTTTTGEVFHDVTVKTNDASTVTIFHARGVARVAYDDIPEADRALYGYDAQAAQEQVARERKEQERHAQELRDKEEAHARAALLEAKQRQDGEKNRAEEEANKRAENEAIRKAELHSNIRTVAGTPYDFTSVLTLWEKADVAMKRLTAHVEQPLQRRLLGAKEGTGLVNELIPATEAFSKYRTYRVSGKILQVLPDGLIVNRSESTWSTAYETVFVRDYLEKNAVMDGDRIESFGMPTGKYQYTAVSGAMRTIREFTCARKPLRTYTPAEVKKLAVDKDERTAK